MANLFVHVPEVQYKTNLFLPEQTSGGIKKSGKK